jgi:hypothetical protein
MMKKKKKNSSVSPAPEQSEKNVQKHSTEYKEQIPFEHPHGESAENNEHIPLKHPHDVITTVDEATIIQDGIE